MEVETCVIFIERFYLEEVTKHRISVPIRLCVAPQLLRRIEK